MCKYTWFELASLAVYNMCIYTVQSHWPMIMISSSLCGHTCYIFDPAWHLSFQNGITHTNKNDKDSVSMNWTAPLEGTGPIQFALVQTLPVHITLFMQCGLFITVQVCCS